MPINPSIRMLAAVATLMLCLLFTAKAEAQIYTTDICGNTVLTCSSTSDIDVNFGCLANGIIAISECRQNGGPLLGCVGQGFATYLECNGGLARQRRQARAARRLQRRSRSSGANFCG